MNSARKAKTSVKIGCPWLRWANKVLHAEETSGAPSLLKQVGIDSARTLIDNGVSAYRRVAAFDFDLSRRLTNAFPISQFVVPNKQRDSEAEIEPERTTSITRTLRRC